MLTDLAGHRSAVQRVAHPSSRLCYVELTEAFEIDGVCATLPGCIVFEQGNDGLICRVGVFFEQRGAPTG